MIYFDNAATTYPKPPAVIRAAAEALTKYGANPGRGGYAMAEAANDMIFSTREKAAGFFNVPSAERVIFVPSCTFAINTVLKGTLSCGDHIVISNLEHNAVVRPVERLRTQGVEVTRAAVVEYDPDATVRNFAQALRRNTRMVFCTHASNVFGICLPIERIAELCRRRGILCGFDCAQSAGTAPLGFDAVPCDFLCMPAHKGLYGIMGCGMLLIGGDVFPEPLCEGGTGSLSAQRIQPETLPDRYESGTLPVAAVAALGAGMLELEGIGRERVLRHEMDLVSYIYEALSRIRGVRLYTRPPVYGQYMPLISFNIGDMPSVKAAESLARREIAVRAGFHCAYDAHIAAGTAKQGTVRICPSMFTTAREAEALIAAVYDTSAAEL